MKNQSLILLSVILGGCAATLQAQDSRNLYDPVMLQHNIDRHQAKLKTDAKYREMKAPQTGRSLSPTAHRHEAYLGIADTKAPVSPSMLKTMAKAESGGKNIYLDSIVEYYYGSPINKTVYNYDAAGHEVLCVKYNANGTDWSPTYKTENAYDSYGNHTLYATYNWEGDNGWIGNELTEDTYDEYGHIICHIYHWNWNWDQHYWRQGSKWEGCYTPDGYKILEADYGWNGTKWEGYYKYTWDYTDDRLGYTRTEYLWNYTTWDWDNAWRTETAHDERGNETLTSSSHWEADHWVGEAMETKEYRICEDGVDHVVKHVTYNWDDTYNRFVGYRMAEIEYDKYGNIIYSVIYDADNRGEEVVWIGSEKYLYQFDDKGRTISESEYFWDSENKVWIGSWRSDHTYDGDRLTALVTYMWDYDNADWMVDEKLEYIYVYDSRKNPVSVTVVINEDTIAKTEYTYNDKGELILSVSSRANWGEWTYYEKVEYTYTDGKRQAVTYSWSDEKWKPETKTVESTECYAHYLWDGDRADWYPEESYGITYTTSEAGGTDKLKYEYSHYDWDMGWLRRYEELWSYDSKENLIHYHSLAQNWGGGWEYGSSRDYKYDDKGHCIYEMESHFDSDIQDWEPDSRTEYTYTGDYLESYAKYYFDGLWHGYEKRAYGYDEYGNEIMWASYLYDEINDSWYGYQKQVRQYDRKGNLILEAMYYNWDADIDDFAGSSMSKNEYDDKDRMTMSENFSDWDYTTHNWAWRNKTVISYDDDARMSVRTEYSWSNEEERYVEAERRVLNFNEAGEIISQYFYKWSGDANDWVLIGYSANTFDEYDNILESATYNVSGEDFEEYHKLKYFYTVRENSLSDEDFAILCTLYDDLCRREGWDNQWAKPQTADDVYGWRGVSIVDGHVTSLSMTGFHLGGEFPMAVLKLPQLADLDVSNNDFTSCAALMATTEEVYDNIETLDISHNAFKGNLAVLTQKFPNLVSLNANRNGFDDIYPAISPRVAKLSVKEQAIDFNKDLELNDLNGLWENFPRILLYDHANQSYKDTFGVTLYTENYSWSAGLSGRKGEVIPDWTEYERVFYEPSGSKMIIRNNDDSNITDGCTFGVTVTFGQGDANNDGDFDVLDLQSTINFILMRHQLFFNFGAANLKADDYINVQDVVCQINELGAQTPDEKAARLRAADAHTLAYVDEGRLKITSATDVAAFDIVIKGAGAVSITESFETLGMSVKISDAGDYTHIIAYSISGATLPCGVAEIAHVGDAEVVACILANADAQRIYAPYGTNSDISIKADWILNVLTVAGTIEMRTLAPMTNVTWTLYTIDGRVVAKDTIKRMEAGAAYIPVPDCGKSHLILKVTADEIDSYTYKF